MRKCTSRRHHHSRDRRFCYWRTGPHAYSVMDNMTSRGIYTQSVRKVRLWMRGSRLFTITFTVPKFHSICRYPGARL